ncbi:putative bifunctional diguanylate cyclase/phosphodiesterase [Leptospira meyeri]|uniref:putative bifunctional diguanylate cyclase/phosphodiesterase n=1 Tax=Leptospira meyeri TaxID=29508 RepID=UPI0002C02579|nr:GGDEF domain-containing phosphodiesterase [Leptospira meyeri]EMJ88733.1 cyclic diguanylate phosphodiesterase (EAL) domain protein [Leptospira meyeri serovar Semaranga str. Veldrot Semarang 173]TGM64331.1 GGDEF domain-containing protein [Leptospira meyeri]TGM67201.1 GGDEF domain-containing protein [Leptospira meyeri]
MLKDKNKYVYWIKFQKDTSPLLRRFLLAASGLFLIAAGLHILPFFTHQGEVDYLFFTVDFSFAVILFLEFLLKNKVPLIIRVFSLICTTIFISVLSYARSGLLGSAEISLSFMIVSFYVFLPPILSLISSLIISLLPSLFGGLIYFSWLRFPESLGIRNNNPREWFFNSVSLVLFSVLTGFLIQRLRGKLIKNIVYLKESRSKILKSQKHIDKLAFYDSLTHLPNRYLFEKLIQNRISSGVSESFLLLINLKGLKVINALHGIGFGDQILTLTGCVLKLYTDERPDILVASLGGDEFILWIENSTKSKIEKAIVNFDLNNNELLTPDQLGHRLQYRVSGVQFPQDTNHLDEAIRKLSIAMNVAREDVLTKLVWFQTGMESKIEREQKLKNYLEKAINHKNFKIAYQEKVDISSKQTVGLEALARWSLPEFGNISPEEFIPIITKSELIVPFGKCIFEKTISHIPKLLDLYGKKIQISINISPIFFLYPNFNDYIIRYLSNHRINPKNIIFEITEDVFLDEIETIQKIVSELRSNGISVSLDDFGKGYSSLHYMQKIQFDELKIDKSFLDDIANSDRNFLLLESICHLADSLGLKTIAEGIENEEQLQRLKQTSCHVVQGYLYSRPQILFD